MRIAASEYSVLPFYRDAKLRYKEQCTTCSTPLIVPQSKGVPNFQLIFKNPDFDLSAVFVRDACTNEQVEFFALSVHIETYFGDDYYYYSFIDDQPIAPGKYILQIPVINALPYSFVSEEFCVLPDDLVCYKIQWNDSCESIEKGGYDNFFNEVYFERLFFDIAGFERSYIEKTNDAGVTIRSNKTLKKIRSFSTISNDWFFESCAMMEVYENIQLQNTLTGELYDLTNPNIEANGGSCEFPMSISFTRSLATDNKCCPVGDPFIDPCLTCDCAGILGDCVDCVPPGVLNCEGYEITWYTDDAYSIPLVGNFSHDTDRFYYYEITKEGCTTIQGQYWHDAPNAGDPSENPTIDNPS